MDIMDQIQQGIKDLVEAQKKGQEDVDKKFKEVAESRKEGQEDVDKKFKEVAESRRKGREEIDKEFKELAEINKEIGKRINQLIGEWGNQWGEFIEKLVDSNMIRLLEQQGIEVKHTTTRVKDKRPHHRWEIDILAINGKETVAIEVKKNLKKEDVDYFIEVLNMFKNDWADCANKTLYGGMAYLTCQEQVVKYAENLGLFVFQATGNSATLMNEPGFKPKAISST